MSITTERLVAAMFLLLAFSAMTYRPCERANGSLSEVCDGR